VVLSFEEDFGLVVVAEGGGVEECGVFDEIGLREVLMGFEDFGEIDFVGGFLVFLCAGCRVPGDLVGQVLFGDVEARVAAHAHRLYKICGAVIEMDNREG
jgi:hypothetical protein